MGEVIGCYAVSHTAMMIRKFDAGDPKHVAVHDGFSTLAEEIAGLAPDAVVIVGSEHMRSFTLDCFPQLCIGLGDTVTGWGDGGIESRTVPLARDLAQTLLETSVARGFDMAFSVDPKIDHGFTAPLTLLRTGPELPLVPIWQNATTPPFTPLTRSAELGVVIREAIESRPASERVVVIGTGGLSHWVGTPQMGRVNVAFDEVFLDGVKRGDLAALAALDDDTVAEEAGNGASEVRNWITAMAASGGGRGEVVTYEPIPDWATGIALARFEVTSGVAA